MDAISIALRERGRTEVIDADLSGYFDSLPHRELLRRVARRVSDGRTPCPHQGMAARPIVERRPGQGPPHDYGQPTWHAARRRHQSAAANLYLSRLDWQVNERCELHPVLVRYADDFVILSRPGQGAELLTRLKRWLAANGLTLNEAKTRTLDVRAEGFKFLGFGVSWRRGKSGRNYPHIEPTPKARASCGTNCGRSSNHWTLWRAADEVMPGSEPAAERLGRIFPLRQQHAGI